MHSMIINSVSQPNHVPRPVVGFAPSPWGDRFLNYTPDTKVIEGQKETAKELKKEVQRELLSIGDKPLIQQLRLIDSIERLCVAYHFEKEIDDALQRIYETSITPSSDDLVLVSLHFRLLRQHGFIVSSDVFKEFIGSNGSLKEEVANDIHGMLSLYEACNIRIHGEDMLEEALPYTISKLNKTISDHNSLLDERIRYALLRPLQKRVSHYDCVRYMQVYEEDDLLHNKSLLKFAKLDFNLLQASHKEELSELCRYWKHIDVLGKLPIRDRMVECHAWALGGHFEPQYSLARKIASIGGHVITSIDDIYDAYATLEELEIFTQAVDRWDKSCLDQLPTELIWFYETLLLDAHEEFECLLIPFGRSQYVHYAKQEIKALCRSYLTEAKWRHNKYIPTLDEYMKNDLCRNIGYIAALVYFFLGLDAATEHEFEWLCNLATPVKSVCYNLRILDDIGGHKFNANQGISSLFIECYMKEYGLSYDEACKELYKKVDESWKDINEGMVRPSEVAVPVYNIVINMSRAVEYIYDGGEDGMTLVNHYMKQIVKIMYIDSVPM